MRSTRWPLSRRSSCIPATSRTFSTPKQFDDSACDPFAVARAADRVARVNTTWWETISNRTSPQFQNPYSRHRGRLGIGGRRRHSLCRAPQRLQLRETGGCSGAISSYWLAHDLPAGVAQSRPPSFFTHVPLFICSIRNGGGDDRGWYQGDWPCCSPSTHVTVLNGHIHQIVHASERERSLREHRCDRISAAKTRHSRRNPGR